MTTDDDGPDSGEGEVRAPGQLERLRASDQIYQVMPDSPQHYGLDEKDGLPKPAIVNAVSDAVAPPLDPKTLVCMGDESSFVLRDEWGNALGEFAPDAVERMPDGRVTITGAEVWRATGHESFVLLVLSLVRGLLGLIFGSRCWLYSAKLKRWYDPAELVEVEAIRPQCRHYARQLIDFPQSEDAVWNIRNCTARRTDYGDFMSLNDQRMLACELRDPQIGSNRERIEAFDEVAVQMGREQVEQDEAEGEDFDIESALDGESAGGIFK